jgi:hypothetical protein
MIAPEGLGSYLQIHKMKSVRHKIFVLLPCGTKKESHLVFPSMEINSFLEISGNFMDHVPSLMITEFESFLEKFYFGVPFKTDKVMETRCNALSSCKVTLPRDAVTLADLQSSIHRHNLEGQRQMAIKMKLAVFNLKILHVYCGKHSGLQNWSLLAQKLPILVSFQLHCGQRNNSLTNRG